MSESRGDTQGSAATPEIGEDDPHVDPASPETEAAAGDAGPAEAGRRWRVAESLRVLLGQVNAAYPGRSRVSDGTVGDRTHQGRASDHNPHITDGPYGVVTALDITHDPAGGCDAGQIVRALYDSRDPRVKYIIWDRRIANSTPVGRAPARAWRIYTGSNPHTRHCHISVRAQKAHYDDPRSWAIPPGTGTEVAVLHTEPGRLFRNALAALPGPEDRPLIEVLSDAQQAATMLLARHSGMLRVRAEDAASTEALPAADQLRQSYHDLWTSAQIDPARAGEVAWHRSRLLKGRSRYREVEAITGAP